MSETSIRAQTTTVNNANKAKEAETMALTPAKVQVILRRCRACVICSFDSGQRFLKQACNLEYARSILRFVLETHFDDTDKFIFCSTSRAVSGFDVRRFTLLDFLL
jgi:hypothetical protein